MTLHRWYLLIYIFLRLRHRRKAFSNYFSIHCDIIAIRIRRERERQILCWLKKLFMHFEGKSPTTPFTSSPTRWFILKLIKGETQVAYYMKCPEQKGKVKALKFMWLPWTLRTTISTFDIFCGVALLNYFWGSLISFLPACQRELCPFPLRNVKNLDYWVHLASL